MLKHFPGLALEPTGACAQSIGGGADQRFPGCASDCISGMSSDSENSDANRNFDPHPATPFLAAHALRTVQAPAVGQGKGKGATWHALRTRARAPAEFGVCISLATSQGSDGLAGDALRPRLRSCSAAPPPDLKERRKAGSNSSSDAHRTTQPQAHVKLLRKVNSSVALLQAEPTFHKPLPPISSDKCTAGFRR